jgi:hypothetical protein
MANGNVVRLYSNAAPGVVDLHFRWMYDYALDGVLLQRFLTDIQGGAGRTQRNIMLQQVSDAAAKYNRTWAIMWDASGASNANWANWIQTDWAFISRFTTTPHYLHENGKPVVCIFGLGLVNHNPEPTPAEAIALLTWLKQRAYVIGSGPYWWRSETGDAMKNYQTVHAAFDAIMPWAVGRYGNLNAFDNCFTTGAVGDAALCRGRGQDYAPIAFPGFSFHNTEAGKPLNEIPRLNGDFLQRQITRYLTLTGATFFYIAMFDEVNEGTAIYKAAANQNECPSNVPFLHMSSDGVARPGDYYLTLTKDFTARAHAL